MDSDFWGPLAILFFFVAFVILNVIQFLKGRPKGKKRTTRVHSNSTSHEDADTRTSHEDADTNESKPSILDKDITPVANVLFGVPAVLAIGVVAIIVTAASGEGVATFVLIFVALCALAYLKLRSK